MDLEKLLNCVGKHIFVKYYFYFKDKKYSSSKLISIIEENYTEKSKLSRIGHSRMIFNNNLNIEALNNIINSNVSDETIRKCKMILEKELNLTAKNDSSALKNKLSNQFFKKYLQKNKIDFTEKPNSFYDAVIMGRHFLFKCRTYNGNYTFVSKTEIPNLSENIIIALVEWQNEQPLNIYLIQTSAWENGRWNILKERNYEGLSSHPEWGIDINESNKHELGQFLPDKVLKNIIDKELEHILEQKQENIKTENEAIIKVRLGHSSLRNKVIEQKGKCEICGLSHKKLLIISHIKPWAKSFDFEKLDFENILLLCPTHDALFDKGLISFDDSGKILISKELDEGDRVLVNVNENNCINIISDKQKEYLKYHRENKFKG